jgi:hypothetical protein
MPADTTWVEAESFFNNLGVRTSSETLEDGSVFHGFGGTEFEDEHLYNSIGIYERNGNIDALFIQGGEWSNMSGFHYLWGKYDPKQVLSDYGQPSRIWLSAISNDTGAPGIDGYRLWVFYDHLGFVLKYDAFAAIIDGENYHICPRMKDEDISEIRMLLQSPSNPEPLDRIDDNTEWFRKSTKPIENATGLSTEDFYQLFIQEDQPACFDTPIDIWPDLSEYRPD